MISRLRGTLLSRNETAIEVAAPSGVVYEVDVPLSVVERLPPAGEEIEVRTVQVVRDDRIELYGFIDAGERSLFQTLVSVQGVGAKLALGMLSTYSAQRLARAIAEKDIAALVQVPKVGRKTAERLALELADRVAELGVGPETAPSESLGGAQEAVQALVSLGMTFPDAERSVRAALEEGDVTDTSELVRRALATK